MRGDDSADDPPDLAVAWLRDRRKDLLLGRHIRVVAKSTAEGVHILQRKRDVVVTRNDSRPSRIAGQTLLSSHLPVPLVGFQVSLITLSGVIALVHRWHDPF